MKVRSHFFLNINKNGYLTRLMKKSTLVKLKMKDIATDTSEIHSIKRDFLPLIAESEEELKSLFMRVNEKSEKTGLKLNIQDTKIMATSPITSWQIERKQWEQ